jgi:cytochrome c553
LILNKIINKGDKMKKILFAVAVASMMGASTAQTNVGKDMYNVLGCSGCHGAGGKSTVSTYPSLAGSISGKDADWIVEQLKNFQSGSRVDATMNAMAPMTAGFEQDIADYLSSQ